MNDDDVVKVKGLLPFSLFLGQQKRPTWVKIIASNGAAERSHQ
jgi:hypothetical protein